MKVAKDAPLAEITVRKYPRPYELSRRELVKRLCLSLGLLQPADSRDVIVDVFQSILDAKEPISSEEVGEQVKVLRDKASLPQVGVAPSNIRRQIKRLKDLFLIEKVGTSYRLCEGENLHDLFVEKIERYYLQSILDRVKEYCKALDQDDS